MFVGIRGPIAAGKSTLTTNLRSILTLVNYTSAVIPFATGIKYIVSLHDDPNRLDKIHMYLIELGYPLQVAAGVSLKMNDAFNLYPVVTGIKPRRLMQYIGTEIGRELDPDIWVKAVKKEAKNQLTTSFYFMDDLRFPNEQDFVDVSIAIDITTEYSQKLYELRKSFFPEEYFFSNHASEQSVLPYATYSIELEDTMRTSALIALAQYLRMKYIQTRKYTFN